MEAVRRQSTASRLTRPNTSAWSPALPRDARCVTISLSARPNCSANARQPTRRSNSTGVPGHHRPGAQANHIQQIAERAETKADSGVSEVRQLRESYRMTFPIMQRLHEYDKRFGKRWYSECGKDFVAVHLTAGHNVLREGWPGRCTATSIATWSISWIVSCRAG